MNPSRRSIPAVLVRIWGAGAAAGRVALAVAGGEGVEAHAEAPKTVATSRISFLRCMDSGFVERAIIPRERGTRKPAPTHSVRRWWESFF